MADEKDVNLNTSNEELDEQDELETGEDNIDDIDDLDVLKEKLTKTQGANRQLFERAKKAEGFVKGEDGKWVKKPVEQPKTPITKPKEAPALSDEEIDKKLDEKLEKRELDSLDISDTLKKEVQNYAKLNGVSIKKALASDYIQFQKEKEEKTQTAEDASLGAGKRRSTTAKKDWSQVENPTFDLRTEQGKKDKAEFDEWAKKQLG